MCNHRVSQAIKSCGYHTVSVLVHCNKCTVVRQQDDAQKAVIVLTLCCVLTVQAHTVLCVLVGSHWAVGSGGLTLGCGLWRAHTGLWALVGSHGAVGSGGLTWGCGLWRAHTGLWALVGSHGAVGSGGLTLGCVLWWGKGSRAVRMLCTALFAYFWDRVLLFISGWLVMPIPLPLTSTVLGLRAWGTAKAFPN
jgi:hypothetical protein